MIASRTLRGHVSYWEKVRLDLKAHIATFGPPTWFITLNPNEEWDEVIRTYAHVRLYLRILFMAWLSLQILETNIDNTNIRDAIAKDVFFFARHFQKRLRALFDKVILKKDGPLGNVVHHSFRLEYQMRGTQHVHGLLWVKDAPAPDASGQEVRYAAHVPHTNSMF